MLVLCHDIGSHFDSGGRQGLLSEQGFVDDSQDGGLHVPVSIFIVVSLVFCCVGFGVGVSVSIGF